MATRPSIVFALFALMLAGCQNQQVAQNLPQPNFNGPNVAQQPVAQQPLPPMPQWSPPKPSPQPLNPQQQAGIPRSWIPSTPARPWRWIVIHHSATPAGSLAMI